MNNLRTNKLNKTRLNRRTESSLSQHLKPFSISRSRTPPQRVQQQYVQYCNTSPCASSASKNVRDSLTDFLKLINAYFSLYAFGIFIL